MSATISVIVQTPYALSDDEGHTLAGGIGVVQVKDTDYIEQLIQQGDLIKTEDVAPAPADANPVEVKSQTTKSKSRISDSEQENSDG